MNKRQREREALLEDCTGVCSEIESRTLAFCFHINRRWIPLSPAETHKYAAQGKYQTIGPSKHVHYALKVYHRWLEKNPL